MTPNQQALINLRRALLDGTVRRRRLLAALTLAEMAEAAGVSASALSRWENGIRTPRTAESLRLIAVLEALEEVRRGHDAR